MGYIFALIGQTCPFSTMPKVGDFSLKLADVLLNSPLSDSYLSQKLRPNSKAAPFEDCIRRAVASPLCDRRLS